MQKAIASYNLHLKNTFNCIIMNFDSFLSFVFVEWQMQIEIWLYHPTPCPQFLPPFAFFACFISTNPTMGFTYIPRFTRVFLEWHPLPAPAECGAEMGFSLARFRGRRLIFLSLPTVLRIGEWMLSGLTLLPAPTLVTPPFTTKGPMAPLPHLKSTLLVTRWFSTTHLCSLFG